MRKKKEAQYRECIDTLIALNREYTHWLDQSECSELGFNHAQHMLSLVREGNTQLTQLGFK